MRFARAFGLAVLLFPVGLATHEMMHLVVYSAFGVRAALLVTNWRLGSLGVPIFGLHAAPLDPGGVPLNVLVVNNGLGPLLAAGLLLVLLLAIDRRSRVARAALLANVLALVFFSLNEMADPLLDSVAHVNADVLVLPEFNYGAVLLIFLVTTFVATRPRRGPHLRLAPAQEAEPAG
ncbi:MAG TPA: hypothetical protein VE953_13360 [Terriglobales bacterium]|nr:hypothetical protein [Terriglobales bacterium]